MEVVLLFNCARKSILGSLKFFGIHLNFIFREIRGCNGVENGVVKVSMVFFLYVFK
jgi:hypothetical protein